MPQSAAQLLRDRYRDVTPEHARVDNDTIGILLGHRSVRDYVARPVEDAVLDQAMAAAQSGSGSQNIQSWSVIAIRDPKQVYRIAEIGSPQESVRKAPLLLVWLADLSRLELVARQQDVETMAISHFEPFMISVIDCTIAAQNAAVALESMGLGVCYVGALRYEPERLIEALNLPPHVVPIFGMTAGYPDPARPASVKPRLPQNVVVHRETYSRADLGESLARYDRTMNQFQREQGLPLVDWTTTSVNRLNYLNHQILHRQYHRRLRDLDLAR